VSALIEELGFAPMDMGGLGEGGRRMQPGAPIYNKDLTLAEARELSSSHGG
jgi:predicted dinucleotide-binding enzyme